MTRRHILRNIQRVDQHLETSAISAGWSLSSLHLRVLLRCSFIFPLSFRLFLPFIPFCTWRKRVAFSYWERQAPGLLLSQTCKCKGRYLPPSSISSRQCNFFAPLSPPRRVANGFTAKSKQPLPLPHLLPHLWRHFQVSWAHPPDKTWWILQGDASPAVGN